MLLVELLVDPVLVVIIKELVVEIVALEAMKGYKYKKRYKLLLTSYSACRNWPRALNVYVSTAINTEWICSEHHCTAPCIDCIWWTCQVTVIH